MIYNCWTCKFGNIKDGICRCNIHLIEQGRVIEIIGAKIDVSCPTHSDYIPDCVKDEELIFNAEGNVTAEDSIPSVDLRYLKRSVIEIGEMNEIDKIDEFDKMDKEDMLNEINGLKGMYILDMLDVKY